jgi:hypothetical protein
MNSPQAREMMRASIAAMDGIDARKASAGDRLDSWKEIAAYLRRSVRCVQRWEKNQGLPIFRHRHASGATVCAYHWELDAWWHGGGGGSEDSEAPLIEIRSEERMTIERDLSPRDSQSVCGGRAQPPRAGAPTRE